MFFVEKCIYKYISPLSLYIRIYIWLSLFGTPTANACGECISKWGEIIHVFFKKNVYTNIYLLFSFYIRIYIWLSLFGTPIANACGECISKWGEISHVFSKKCIYEYIFLFSLYIRIIVHHVE